MEKLTPVTKILKGIYSVFEAGRSTPNKGSQAECEIHSFPRPESVRTAFSQASIALEAAADHLEGLDNLVSQEKYAIAPWSCARGVLESSAFVTWLLDTKINARERVSRSLSLRFAALNNQIKLARSNNDTCNISIIQNRLAEVQKIAKDLDFEILHDKKGRLIGIGQLVPKFTRLINDQFKHEFFYRILSGMIHSDYALLQHLSFVKVDDGQPTDKFLKRAIPVDIQKRVVSTATMIFVRGAWLQTIQFGYDAAQIAIVLEEGFNELNLDETNEVRFWRYLLSNTS